MLKLANQPVEASRDGVDDVALRNTPADLLRMNHRKALLVDLSLDPYMDALLRLHALDAVDDRPCEERAERPGGGVRCRIALCCGGEALFVYDGAGVVHADGKQAQGDGLPGELGSVGFLQPRLRELWGGRRELVVAIKRARARHPFGHIRGTVLCGPLIDEIEGCRLPERG